LLLVARQSPAALIADHRTTNQLHHVLCERQTPIADRDLEDVAQDRKLADGGRWSYGLEPLVTKRGDVLLAQSD
jgi:hypothetical protein